MLLSSYVLPLLPENLTTAILLLFNKRERDHEGVKTFE